MHRRIARMRCPPGKRNSEKPGWLRSTSVRELPEPICPGATARGKRKALFTVHGFLVADRLQTRSNRGNGACAVTEPDYRGVEYTVEWSPHMETIQVVLDKKLLQAADRIARQSKRNRSALGARRPAGAHPQT